MSAEKYSIGLDFGSDSVRALIVDIHSGAEVSTAVVYYTRWEQGEFCVPHQNQFRQHPLDYVEAMQSVVTKALSQVHSSVSTNVVGIGVDTTGSTLCPIDEHGVPLSMTKEFEGNPNAMFHLWKDHTAVKEAEEINKKTSESTIDYLQYVGGIYSSEWFWAKIIHTNRIDKQVAKAAFSWVEHCDWIPFLLTGGGDAAGIKRSVCAAGHKALWHKDYNGLPPKAYLTNLDESLSEFNTGMFESSYTSDTSVGNLCSEWASKLGLPESVVVAVGAYDAHMGAVGGQISPGYLSKVIGTSTCDIMVAPVKENEHLVKGICGQVDGSVIPGMLGLEAGQSAFGDVYAWFKKLLMWPLEILDGAVRTEVVEKIDKEIIPRLTEAAMKLDVTPNDLVSLDWMNGRRTPDANQMLKGVVSGINLGSDAPRIFKSLVEATCFGARKIAERFEEEGVKIDGVIALGGVAKKSPYVMQTLSNVMNRPIKVGRSEQTCALGAAMFGAVAAGAHIDIATAMDKMGAGFDAVYEPESDVVPVYDELYAKYCDLGSYIETTT